MSTVQYSNLSLSIRSMFFMLIAFLLISNYELALAATAPTAASDPIGYQLCKVVAIMSNSTAKAIAIVALLAVGVGLFMGKVNWGVALTTAVGVIVMFGAPALIGFLGGTGADATSCADVT